MADELAEDGIGDDVRLWTRGVDSKLFNPERRRSNWRRAHGFSDDDVVVAFQLLSRTEGIIPALESAHAIAYAMREAPKMGRDETILVNLSGRGDKDADFVAEKLGL